MATLPNRHCWGFIIDTDHYAGNFERELCAFITGHVGECKVGEQVKVIPPILFKNILHIPDEHGCLRPVNIYPNPRYFNNGLGFIYITGEEDLALQKYKESCLKCAEDIYKIYSSSPEYAKQQAQHYINMAEKVTKAPAYPAYNSVVIFFHSKPSKEQIDYMKTKAFEFPNKSFNIEGFRLIEFDLTKTEHPI